MELETESGAELPDPPSNPDKPKGGSRKGRKTRAQLLPGHLPVEESVLIPAQVAADPANWREISRDTSDHLERIPGKLVILRVVRPVFVRRDQPFAAPVTAPAPRQFLPGSFLGLQLMVDLCLGKFLYHQPIYRMTKGMEWESGVHLSNATICQVLARIAREAAPVTGYMGEVLWHAPCVQMDLTPVRCLSRKHAGGSFSGQMWVAAVKDGDVVYTWSPSKAAVVAEGIIPPWFKGILQTDGGPEFSCFLKGGKGRFKPPRKNPRGGCWAHVRRKFFEGAKAGCPLCARLLRIINVLYRIERQAREQGLSASERTLLRQRRSRRVVNGLHRRLIRTLATERPKSPVGKACLYTLGQWPGLVLFLDHGEMEIDNNSVENAIRPCALGKKNYLFIGDVKAGSHAAVFYTLIGSCLRRGLNPRAYLHWLFTRIGAEGTHAPHTLTPAAWAEATKPVQEAVEAA